jgi:hypothetical protein
VAQSQQHLKWPPYYVVLQYVHYGVQKSAYHEEIQPRKNFFSLVRRSLASNLSLPGENGKRLSLGTALAHTVECTWIILIYVSICVFIENNIKVIPVVAYQDDLNRQKTGSGIFPTV